MMFLVSYLSCLLSVFCNSFLIVYCMCVYSWFTFLILSACVCTADSRGMCVCGSQRQPGRGHPGQIHLIPQVITKHPDLINCLWLGTECYNAEHTASQARCEGKISIRWIQKFIQTPSFFHILLCCSHMQKCFVLYIFCTSIYTP